MRRQARQDEATTGLNFADPLTEVLRKGARALLAQAVEAEAATLLSRYADDDR